MPVILVNNANSIEIDITSALKYTITKGDFDVVLESTGKPDDAGTVLIILRSHAITERFIRLDWRDISSPGGIASAIELRDLLLSWNISTVIVSSSALPDGAATAAKQDSELALLSILNDLTETLQDLAQRLMPLAGAIASGGSYLRVTQTAVPSTAVTGPLTDAQNTAGNLAQLKLMDTYAGDKAVQSNIINVVT